MGVHFALYIVNIYCIQGMTVWAVCTQVLDWNGVEKEFFFFFVNYVNSGMYHSHAEVIVYGMA